MGIIDSIADHLHNSLSKANDKQAEKALKSLANSSPEGKKAVEFALNQKRLAQKASDYGQEANFADLHKKFS